MNQNGITKSIDCPGCEPPTVEVAIPLITPLSPENDTTVLDSVTVG